MIYNTTPWPHAMLAKAIENICIEAVMLQRHITPAELFTRAL